MPEARCPRLSQAIVLLPLLRAQLGGAASGHSLPAGLGLAYYLMRPFRLLFKAGSDLR